MAQLGGRHTIRLQRVSERLIILFGASDLFSGPICLCHPRFRVDTVLITNVMQRSCGINDDVTETQRLRRLNKELNGVLKV